MLLNGTQLRLAGKKTGLNTAQLNRVLGSVRVPLPGSDDVQLVKTLELGFSLLRLEPRLPIDPSRFIDLLCELINQYRLSCPAVVQWLLSGGFKAAHPPAEVKKSSLQHACRTAGRPRAKFLRETGISQLTQ